MNTNEPRSILITGCSSGIGLCVADGLKQRGYRVFATARSQDDVRMLENQGHEALQLDLDDSDSIRQAVTEILSRTNTNYSARLLVLDRAIVVSPREVKLRR